MWRGQDWDKMLNIGPNLISGGNHYDFEDGYFCPKVKLRYNMEYGLVIITDSSWLYLLLEIMSYNWKLNKLVKMI